MKTVLNTFQPLGMRRDAQCYRALLSYLLGLKDTAAAIPQTGKQLSMEVPLAFQNQSKITAQPQEELR